MSVIISPNMNLPVPIVGQEPGPNYATDVNNSLNIVDQHNHSAGSGVQITPAGLNINSDLTISGNSLTNVLSLQLQPQSAPISSALLNRVYDVNGDLYFNDGSGNQVRITQSGSVAGSTGTITGLPSGTAGASYAGGTFVFQSATNTAANIDAGSYVFRNSTMNSFGLTLSPPNAMGANYSLVLPAIPVTSSFVTLDTSGNISGSVAVNGGITGTNIATNVNLNGKAAQEAGNNLVVSNTNASQSLAIIRRGFFSNGGAASNAGEGMGAANTTAGVYLIVFDVPFLDIPTVVGNVSSQTGVTPAIYMVISSVTSSGCTVTLFNITTPVNADFNLMAIGQRA